ncbi:MAG: ABC transporter substrate-binding protein [Cumulibacter sp.]
MKLSMRKAATFIAGLLVAGMSLTACGASGSGGSSDPGVLKIAMTASDIPFTGTYPDNGYEGFRFISNNLYDGLTRLNLDQDTELPTPQPSLAESVEPNDDGTVWTFKLREDVEFTDGTPFNADAVIFKLDTVKGDPDGKYFDADVASRGSAVFKYVKAGGYKKVDDYTVTVETTMPYGLLNYDALSWFIPSPTAAMAVIDGGGTWADFAKAPVGTGPFTLEELVPGDHALLTRNDDYWRGPAKLEQIYLYPAPEAATRLSMFESGEVNWADAPAPDAIQQLQDSGANVILAKYPHSISPRFNEFRAPFKDNIKLRQALNYALDREATAAIINDAGFPASQYVYEGHPDFVPDNPGYSYDQAKAEELLAESGYPGGEGLKPLVFAYPQGGSGNMYPPEMMQSLQQQFADIGVDVELMPVEWNTLLTMGIEGLNSPQWQDVDILWASPAAGMLPTTYTTTVMCERVPGSPNAAGMCNPEIDALWEKGLASTDIEQTHEYFRQGLDIALDEADFLYWMHDLNLRVLAPEVKGFIPVLSWWTDFTLISVED